GAHPAPDLREHRHGYSADDRDRSHPRPNSSLSCRVSSMRRAQSSSPQSGVGHLRRRGPCPACLHPRTLGARDAGGRLEVGGGAAASRLVGGGWGTGQPCIVCEQLIAPSEIASGSFQEDGSRVWTHLSCLRIWQAETAAHERRQIAKERRVHGELCALVRRGFADGPIKVLPHNRRRLDQGLVGSCSVCQQPVSPDETAYEVTGGVQQPPAYAHPTCHRVWWIESMARRKMQS